MFKTIVGGNNNATEQLLKMGADPNIKCKVNKINLILRERQPYFKQSRWRRLTKSKLF